MASYSDDELAALKLLRSAFSWNISLDRRSGIWVATYADQRIRRDDPLGLYDALTLAAQARRGDCLATSDRERIAPDQLDNTTCNADQQRLEQQAAVLHKVSGQLLVVLDAADKILANLAAILREQMPPEK